MGAIFVPNVLTTLGPRAQIAGLSLTAQHSKLLVYSSMWEPVWSKWPFPSRGLSDLGYLQGASYPPPHSQLVSSPLAHHLCVLALATWGPDKAWGCICEGMLTQIALVTHQSVRGTWGPSLGPSLYLPNVLPSDLNLYVHLEVLTHSRSKIANFMRVVKIAYVVAACGTQLAWCWKTVVKPAPSAPGSPGVQPLCFVCGDTSGGSRLEGLSLL